MEIGWDDKLLLSLKVYEELLITLFILELNQSLIPKLIKTKPIIPRNADGVSAINMKYKVNLLFKVLIFFLLTLRNFLQMNHSLI